MCARAGALRTRARRTSGLRKRGVREGAQVPALVGRVRRERLLCAEREPAARGKAAGREK